MKDEDADVRKALGAEGLRLKEAWEGAPWRLWGPSLTEPGRDISHTISSAYHLGEGELAGVSDVDHTLCFRLALWNGEAANLKRRVSGHAQGRRNREGQFTEDYVYVDNTPTHSYMRCLYRYPQTASECGAWNPDTGLSGHFDISVEYGKASPMDLLIRIEIANRGKDEHRIHVLPTLYFCNHPSRIQERSILTEVSRDNCHRVIAARGSQLGDYYLHCAGPDRLLFTNVVAETRGVFGILQPFGEDSINDYVVRGASHALNPNGSGIKAAAHYQCSVPPAATDVIRLRLNRLRDGEPFGTEFEQLVEMRKHEADAFYHDMTPAHLDEQEASAMRRSLAGMLWRRQYLFFDMDQWSGPLLPISCSSRPIPSSGQSANDCI